MRTLTLYSRSDCELCDEMKAVVTEVGGRIALSLEVVDVSTDAELERRYGLAVPVLLIGGKEAFRHRVTARELFERLGRERE